MSMRADIPPRSKPFLTHTPFVRWCFGTAVSQLGDGIYLFMLPWIVLNLTHSPLSMSRVLLATEIPRTALILLGGAFTDRFPPRKILIASAWLRASLTFALGSLVAHTDLLLRAIYLVAFAFGVIDALSIPSAGSYLPTLLAEQQLLRANSILALISRAIAVAGPLVGSFALRELGTAGAIYLDALSFIAIIIAAMTLPDGQPPLKQPLWSSITAAFLYIRHEKLLLFVIFVATMINLCIAGPLQVTLPFLAITAFHSASALASLLSAIAVGGIAGALVANIVTIRREGPLIICLCLVLGLSFLVMSFQTHLWQMCLVMMLIGVALSTVNLHLISWVQRRVPAEIRGRILSVLWLTSIGLAPLSIWLCGINTPWGVRGVFVIGGILLLATGLTALCFLRDRGIQPLVRTASVPTSE